MSDITPSRQQVLCWVISWHSQLDKTGIWPGDAFGNLDYKIWRKSLCSKSKKVKRNIQKGPAVEYGVRSPEGPLRVQFSSVQLLSSVRLFVTPWIEARQVSLSITNSQSSLKLMPIESLKPSSYLILCRSLLLLPSIFPSIRIFSHILALYIRWTKYLSFSFNITPSNEYSELISFRTDWLSNQITDLLSPCSPRDSQESSLISQFKSIKSSALSLLYGPILTSTHNY